MKKCERVGVKVCDITLYGVGAYEVTQTDGTFDGYAVGALYGRLTSGGNERRELHTLARIIENAGLPPMAAATFNDYTKVFDTFDGAVIAAGEFIKRFKLEAAGLLPKEKARWDELKAAAAAAKAKAGSDKDDTDKDDTDKADKAKSKAKKTTAEKLAAALKGEGTDHEKALALVAALAKYNKSAAAAASAAIAADMSAKAAALADTVKAAEDKTLAAAGIDTDKVKAAEAK